MQCDSVHILGRMDKPELHNGKAADLEALLPLVAAYHAFEEIDMATDDRRHSIAQLLGDPRLGTIWCITLSRRMIGYLALCYGYSIEFGGRDAFVDEFYIVPEARGHGIGRDVIRQVMSHAANEGIKALHLEVAPGNARASRLYADEGFVLRSGFNLMSVRLGDLR